MKKNKIFFGLLAFGLFTFLGIAIAANFSDINGHWAEDDLIWAVDNGLLKGDDVAEGEAKKLRPDDAVTRAELVTIIKRYHQLRESISAGVEDDLDALFMTKVGDITWIGRESTKDEGATYEVVKIDALGNESVMYETIFTPYSDVEWDFSNEGKNLVINAVVAGGDAADFTQIGFIEGQETIRSYHSSYESEFTFKTPSSPEYTVSLVTSEVCEGIAPSPESGELIVPETELIGVKIESENGSEMFNLPEPEIVSCAIYDGYFVNHRLQDVITNSYGISFRLPTGDEAWVSVDEDNKVKVEFSSVDGNYTKF